MPAFSRGLRFGRGIRPWLLRERDSVFVILDVWVFVKQHWRKYSAASLWSYRLFLFGKMNESLAVTLIYSRCRRTQTFPVERSLGPCGVPSRPLRQAPQWFHARLHTHSTGLVLEHESHCGALEEGFLPLVFVETPQLIVPNVFVRFDTACGTGERDQQAPPIPRYRLDTQVKEVQAFLRHLHRTRTCEC